MLEKVNFCYHCGRPVGPQATKCIYCSYPTRRIIRSQRRCPFCDEPIRPKAVKCVHCGEFLDGREKEAQGGDASKGQPTFIIEKAVISTGGGASGSKSGLAIEGSSARLLEQNRGNLLDYGGSEPQQGGSQESESGEAREVRALPSPQPRGQYHDDDEPLPIIGERIRPRSRAPELPVPASQKPAGGASVPALAGRSNTPAIQGEAGGRELTRAGAGGANLPAPRTPGDAALPALRSLFSGLRKLLAGSKKDESLDAEFGAESERYRNCGFCQTEILVSDNFCYHCGHQFGGQPIGRGKGKRRGEKSNFFLFILVVASLSGCFLAGRLSGIDPNLVRPIELASGIAAPLFAAFAFFRKAGFISRTFALLVFFASMFGAYVLLTP